MLDGKLVQPLVKPYLTHSLSMTSTYHAVPIFIHAYLQLPALAR